MRKLKIRAEFTPVLFLLFFLLATHIPPAPAMEKAGGSFQALKKSLIKDGFDKGYIEGVYSKPGVDFETKGTSLMFTTRQSKLNYKQFSSRSSIRRARKYMKRHEAALSSTEKIYGVDKEVITAILMVETRFGTYTGKISTLNALSSIAALSDKAVREMLWNEISETSGMTKKKYVDKALKRSKWAYSELKAFFKFVEREKIDPLAMNGSYAGAIGIAQFMPTNVLTLAKDGNGDGLIDLFNHHDAIASVANYLRHHGWHPGMEDKEAYRVILRYNYSKYYARAVLKVAKKLKG
jgi:membrane-bound lytic murein transglycosylase B